MILDLEQFKKDAKLATSGEWFVSEAVSKAIESTSVPGMNLLGLDREGYAIVMNKNDAAHIANACPKNLLLLLQYIEDLEQVAKYYAECKHLDKAGPGWGWNVKELGEKAQEVLKKWSME